jgi:hypothetical protein
MPTGMRLVENPELANSLIDLVAHPDDRAAAPCTGRHGGANPEDQPRSRVSTAAASRRRTYLQRAHVGRKVAGIE